MADDRDRESADAWESATFEGNRLKQLRAFQALSFREKILRIEQMNEVARTIRRGSHAKADEHPTDPAERT